MNGHVRCYSLGMSILGLVVAIILVSTAVWAIRMLVEPAQLKKVLTVLVVVLFVLWLVYALFGGAVLGPAGTSHPWRFC